jgi:hypothetical protein
VRAVYVDTGAWIALIYRRDRAHQDVSRHFARLRQDGDLLVTSDPAIGETVTRLRYDAGLSAAMAFRRILDEAVRMRALRIQESDSDLRERAFQIMERFADLRLSYADCVGAAVADKIQASAVFGLDHDFRIMGHALEP